MNFISMITAAKQYTNKENLTDALDLIDITARMANQTRRLCPPSRRLQIMSGRLRRGHRHGWRSSVPLCSSTSRRPMDMLKAIRSRTEFPKLLMSLG